MVLYLLFLFTSFFQQNDWVLYHQDKKVLRFNNITITTQYYTEKGGMQTENRDRKIESLKSAQALVFRFPEYCHLKPKKKKNGHTEVILKDKT